MDKNYSESFTTSSSGKSTFKSEGFDNLKDDFFGKGSLMDKFNEDFDTRGSKFGLSSNSSGSYSIENKDGQWKLAIKVEGYQQEEIKVKLEEKTGDLEISAKHESAGTSRQFSKKFNLPKGADFEKLSAALDKDMLTVSCSLDGQSKKSEVVKMITIVKVEKS